MFKCCTCKSSSRPNTDSESDTPPQSRKLSVDDSKNNDKIESFSAANNVLNDIEKTEIMPNVVFPNPIRDEIVTSSCSPHKHEDKKDGVIEDKSNSEHLTKGEETTEKVIEETTENMTEEITKKVTEGTTKKMAEKKTEVIQKTTENMIEETTEKIIQETIEKVPEKMIEKIPEETIEKMTEETTKKVTEETIEGMTEEPTEKISEETIEKMTEETTKKVTEETTESMTDETTEKIPEETIEKMTEETTKKVTEETTESMTEETTEKVTEETIEKMIEEITKKVTEEMTEKMSEEKMIQETTEKMTEETTENVSEETIEKITEGATEKMTEKILIENFDDLTEIAIEEITEKAAEIAGLNVEDTDGDSNVTKKEEAIDKNDEIKYKPSIVNTPMALFSDSDKKLDIIISNHILSDTNPVASDVDEINTGDFAEKQTNEVVLPNDMVCINKMSQQVSKNIESTVNVEPEDKSDKLISNSNECNTVNEIQSIGSSSEICNKQKHLEQLVDRLEKATIRLEKVSAYYPERADIGVQIPSPKNSKLNAKSNISKQSSEPSVNMSVNGYKDLLAGPVQEYLELSKKIGGDVAAHSKLVEKAFYFQLQFIEAVDIRAAPKQFEQLALLEPTSEQIQQIQEFREKNRGSSFFNHLSAISESIPALGWVAVVPTPAPYVKEMNDAGQFYTNRVLKDWKEKDKIHIDWCKAWVQTLTDLQTYVRKYHTTGLVWGKTGAAPIGIPPPPPPSMPIGDIAPLMVNDDRSALFAQINQGEDITKNLKKVTSDMQTHKNPSLRSGPAPFKAPVVTSATPACAPIEKPPVFTKDGKKWLVEYHKGGNIEIDKVEMNNVVYMFRCQDSTLTVKGKLNSVVMDSCRKSSVVFDSLVSSIEFVNCQSIQMQVLGKVPTISIDKTDGCQMYLSNESLDVEFITSKSSEMNVMVPKSNGDYTEYPIPEQFKTTISKNGLNTTAVDSLG